MDANLTNRGAKYFAPLFVVLRLKLRVRENSRNSHDIHERSEDREILEKSSDLQGQMAMWTNIRLQMKFSEGNLRLFLIERKKFFDRLGF